MVSSITSIVEEIESVKRECLKLLSDVRSFLPAAAPSPIGSAYPTYPVPYRILVTPLLYSAWERCFTLCNAIAWRRLRDEASTTQSLKSCERAAWLMRASFYQSFTKKLLNAASLGGELKPKRAHYPALNEFLGEFDAWLASPPDAGLDTDELVMTFSNVNEEVVKLNATAVGISAFPAFTTLALHRLNSLVGRRNDLGHGGLTTPPDNAEFSELWDYTEKLITDYSEAFKQWVVVRFPPPPAPPPAPTRVQRVCAAAWDLWRACTD